MKKLRILFRLLFLLFLFASCNEGSQNGEVFNIQEQGEFMQQDPLVRNYFEAMTISFKISSQDLGTFRLKEYYNIIEQENTNHCNVKTESFEGNKDFEKFAKAKCLVSELKEKFTAKYPNFTKMNKSDRLAITRPIIESIPYDSDMEKMEKRLEEYNNRFSEEEKNQHREDAEKILDIEIPKNIPNNN